jgi:osmotically-inducible protein OsmY
MRNEARRGSELLIGLLAGAALMYLFDPARGRRRLATVRDQVVHAGHELEELGDAAAARARDLRNRVRGAVAGVRSRLRREEVDDAVLEARVRSRLGHVMANPGSIEVSAADGCVTLAGPVLAEEAERLLATAETVPGVRDVVSRLDVHEERGSVPGLQGMPAPGAVR